MFGGFGTTELIIILVLAFMVFGVGKLPQVAKMLGSGVKSFRKGMEGEDEEEESGKKKEPELLDEDKSVETGVGEQQRQKENAW